MARARNKKYVPKLVKIPMTRALHQELAIHAHAALVTLRYAPSLNAFDSLATLMNVVQIAIDQDERFTHEAMLIRGGAATMSQIMHKVDARLPLQEHELASIEVAVTAMDQIFPRLDVTKLHLSRLSLSAMKQAELADPFNQTSGTYEQKQCDK